jgi:7-cyano-7-deazaguanine synthase in queuosine biosynthesis
MLPLEHLVVCGQQDRPNGADMRTLRLNLQGGTPNVRLRIADLSKRLVANIPNVLIDLLEIASYVYAADSAISRGGKSDSQMGARWRRKFRLVIPVRRPDLWVSPAVHAALVDTLRFLSEDEYVFEFVELVEHPEIQSYFEFSGVRNDGFLPEEIVLFSGGLDSFAGSIQELVVNNKSIALVTHRSSTKMASAQMRLIDELRKRVSASRILHIPVWATVDENLAKEPTHRTRSFLFAALGSVTAHLFDIDRIKFFENGVMSLNLPPVAQVVGARATRTTHPQTLHGFRSLISALLGREFDVVNPFVWMTKTEVVASIAANGFADLIRDTRSCARVHDMTTFNPHCGHCSQCIDRRFSVLAAGQGQNDPDEAYKVHLFTHERSVGSDREMALAYVRSASEVNRMADVAFFSRYGEASRAVGFYSEPVGTVAERIFDLHRRHAAAICAVFDRAIASHAAELRQGSLPSSCLLSLVVAQQGADPVTGYPDRSQVADRTIMARAEIRMSVDEKRKRVIFNRWGEIKGVGAELLIFLAGLHREATTNGVAPERYPFTPTRDVLGKLHIDSDETLRRRVFRCRKQIEKLAVSAGAPAPSIDDVIENQQWHGYRLNPDVVRIVAITELIGTSS